MSADEFVLGVGPGVKIQSALRRNPEVFGHEVEILEWLATGNNLVSLKDVATGLAEIKLIDYLVSLNAFPFVPEGWEMVSHIQGGQFRFNPTKVKLYANEDQKNGRRVKGVDLWEDIKKVPVFNANLLDFYLKKPHLIPEDWKDKAVFFWGTIYRFRDGSLCVRYLYWGSGSCQWSCSYQILSDYWYNYAWAACAA